MNDLKCPICGNGPAKIERFVRWIVSCPICGFKTNGLKMDEALAEWNKGKPEKYGNAEVFVNFIRQMSRGNRANTQAAN